MDVDLKYYSFVYFQALPTHVLSFEIEFKKYAEFFKKYGANICGPYTAVVGGDGECLVIIEYETLEQKMDITKSVKADEEYRNFYECFSKMVLHFHDYVTKCFPMYPFVAPDANNLISVRRHDVKGDVVEALMNFTRCNDVIFERELSPRGVKMVGLFYPIFGESTNSYFAVIDAKPSTAFGITEEISKSIMVMKLIDPSVKEYATKLWSHVISASTKIYAPI